MSFITTCLRLGPRCQPDRALRPSLKVLFFRKEASSSYARRFSKSARSEQVRRACGDPPDEPALAFRSQRRS